MKKTFIKALALATLALTLVFTASVNPGSAKEDYNEGIMTLSDIPINHGIKH